VTNREQAAYFQIAIENVAAVVNRTPLSVKREYGTEALGHEHIRLIQHAVKLEMIRLQVEDVLVTNWIQVKDNDYKQAVNDLVTRCIQIENDPLVSVAARNRALELEHLKNNQWPLGDRPNPCAGYSSGGVNVYGDEHSMREIRNAFHDSSTLPQLRERIQQAEATIKELAQRLEQEEDYRLEMKEREG
jgi:hypothetical protein